MTTHLQGNCLALLIGSMPVEGHREASELVFRFTGDIPLWVQLPRHPAEAMIPQFLPGYPGRVRDGGKDYIDLAGDAFAEESVSFFEDFLSVTEDGKPLDGTRFSMSEEEARGFFVFEDRLHRQTAPPIAVKGQITGPITFTTGVKDQDGRALFYDEQARDMAVKHLALKAAWQVRRLSRVAVAPVIVFLDEPALAGFGSSEMISIGRDAVVGCLSEIVATLRREGAFSGIHVCANTDWGMVMESSVDIVNFDAYSHFDRFVLFPESIGAHLKKGGWIAWGIVPTADPDAVNAETVDSLFQRWQRQLGSMEAVGVERETLLRQSLITPSCGMGSLDEAHALRVLELTRDLSQRIRDAYGLV
ncbi:MAG: hypothetical protein LJE65_17825 [Desulfobacteraceae bacterium]|nr:hypothetical protein [Desulfobacteraceae bacterium]